LLTVTTTLRQQGRDVWQFLEQAWVAHHVRIQGSRQPAVNFGSAEPLTTA
jgi:hypothetical protein